MHRNRRMYIRHDIRGFPSSCRRKSILHQPWVGLGGKVAYHVDIEDFSPETVCVLVLDFDGIIVGEDRASVFSNPAPTSWSAPKMLTGLMLFTIHLRLHLEIHLW